jgi:uncharacterized protein YaaR (DUF327 family)
MVISNKYIILVVILIILIIWYVKSTKDDVARYKSIIDNYMEKSVKHGYTPEKKKKKVSFDDNVKVKTI